MKIYLDENFICRTEQREGRTEYETSLFDGKGRHYIECFRIVPEGQTWQRADGEVFHGFMMTCVKDTEDAMLLDAHEAQMQETQTRLRAVMLALAQMNS